MTTQQMQKEIGYKISLTWLEILKRKGLITDAQYVQIDRLNRESFSPMLKELYA